MLSFDCPMDTDNRSDEGATDMTSSERLANGIVKHTRKMSGRLQVTYVYQFAGHTGHIKQAIKKTQGT